MSGHVKTDIGEIKLFFNNDYDERLFFDDICE